MICPGICNSSESVYIRRVVYQAQFQGYRVAVLNHLGVLHSVPLTAPRIFCYGNTDDYDGLVNDVVKRYPGTKVVCMGFSMGGNIVAKYLGEKRVRPEAVVAGITACQGYDVNGYVVLNQVLPDVFVSTYYCIVFSRVAKYLLQWENCRRLYLFAMTENMRSILRHWQKQLFPEELKRDKGIVERDIWSAATLFELDDAYTRYK